MKNKNSKSKFNKLARVGAISTVFVFGGIIFSGQADAFSLNNTFNQIVQQIQSQVNSAQNYLNTTASNNLQALEKLTGVNVKQIMTNATGALGLPDPSVASQTVASQVQVPNLSTIDFSQSTIANVNTQITQQAASTVLSQDGQNQMVQQSNTVSNAVSGSSGNSQNVYNQSQTAVNAVSTQDVLKQIAQQNAELSQQQANLAAINGSINTNLQNSVQVQNLGNINLANINSAVNGANQKSNMEIVGVGRENLQRASSSRLY